MEINLHLYHTSFPVHPADRSLVILEKTIQNTNPVSLVEEGLGNPNISPCFEKHPRKLVVKTIQLPSSI